MAISKRTFWAMEGVSIGASTVSAVTGSTFVPAVQSVGITTNFNLEQIFQLGQLQIYQDLEEVPDIEITIEKAVDDTGGLFGRCMKAAASATIVADQNEKVNVFFSVGIDTEDNIGGENSIAHIYCSGMFLSSYSANFVTDGFFTESATLVGNHKVWNAAGGDAGGEPAAPATGDVARRQNFSFDPGPAAVTANLVANAAVNSCTISTDLGREEMNILGQRLPYHRFVTFPVEVTCEIEMYVTNILAVSQAAGVGASKQLDAFDNIDNTTEEEIVVSVSDAAANNVFSNAGAIHTWNLGEKNRLQSITWGGGDTGGSNATLTLSYRNFNFLSYSGPAL